MTGVFIAAFFFNVSVILLILISGIIGAAEVFLNQHKREGGK